MNASRSRLGVGVGALFLSVVACASWAAQPSGSVGAKADEPAKPVAGAADDRAVGYRRISKPEYPASALEAKVEGTVIVGVTVDESGLPVKVNVATSSGSEALDAAALAAARTWTFDPEVRSGEPVKVSVVLPVCFSLTDDSTCGATDDLDGLKLVEPAIESPT